MKGYLSLVFSLAIFGSSLCASVHFNSRCVDADHGSLRADTTNCNQFYMCIIDKWVLENCDKGEIFETKTLSCKVDDGSCKVTGTKPEEPELPEKPEKPVKPDKPSVGCDGLPTGSVRPNTKNDSEFEICTDNNWTVQKCSDGQSFDASQKMCISK